MKQNVMALCDLETAYVVNFVEYVNRRAGNVPFEIHAFTTVEQLRDFQRGRHVELLLISEKAMSPEVDRMDIGRVLILSEEEHARQDPDRPTVCKYQPSPALIREVLADYAGTRTDAALISPFRKRTEVIGVISPNPEALQIYFSLSLGTLLAEEGSALCLTFESAPGLENAFGQNFDRSMTDAVYYLWKEEEHFMDKVNAMTATLGPLHVLPPFTAGEDRTQIPGSAWVGMIEKITGQGTYDWLILDLTTHLPELSALLRRCDHLFVPLRDDPISKGRQSFFFHRYFGSDDQLMERASTIRLPEELHELDKEELTSELIHGSLGDLAKEQLIRTGFLHG